MKTQKEGVVTIKDESGKMIGIIYKDGSSAPIIYSTEPMPIEDIELLIVNNK